MQELEHYEWERRTGHFDPMAGRAEEVSVFKMQRSLFYLGSNLTCRKVSNQMFSDDDHFNLTSVTVI